MDSQEEMYPSSARDRGAVREPDTPPGRSAPGPVGRVTESVESAIDHARSTATGLEDQCRAVLADVAQYTRNRPWPALAIAAGVGWLVGRRAASCCRFEDEASTGAEGVRWPPRTQASPAKPE
jgi:hypothetical protein